jgi:hypothetical protein
MATTVPNSRRRLRLPNVVFVLTATGGIGALVLSVWPGVLEDTVWEFPGILVALPLIGGWALLLLGLSFREIFSAAPAIQPRWGIWSSIVALAMVAALWLHIPQRLAFAVFQPQFRDLLKVNVPGTKIQELTCTVGPYQLDAVGKDQAGGTYFRTHVGPDGIGPDQRSWGFAFQPHGPPTPFGSAAYRQQKLIGHWYIFSVSDDW